MSDSSSVARSEPSELAPDAGYSSNEQSKQNFAGSHSELKIHIPFQPHGTEMEETNPSPYSPQWDLSDGSDSDSLFNEPTSKTSSSAPVRVRDSPKIPGLHTFSKFTTPALSLPEDMEHDLFEWCMNTYFYKESSNQAMLFSRPSVDDDAGLPDQLKFLLSFLSAAMKGLIPNETHALLFQSVRKVGEELTPRARQAIVNLYHPGEGITPHVDLLQRFDDGIIGVSLGSGCVMQFRKAVDGADGYNIQIAQGRDDEEAYEVYLPQGSIYMLTGDARYKWTHGIEGRTKDFISLGKKGDGDWIERTTRISITFRWLLPGADIVSDV